MQLYCKFLYITKKKEKLLILVCPEFFSEYIQSVVLNCIHCVIVLVLLQLEYAVAAPFTQKETNNTRNNPWYLRRSRIGEVPNLKMFAHRFIILGASSRGQCIIKPKTLCSQMQCSDFFNFLRKPSERVHKKKYTKMACIPYIIFTQICIV